MLEEVPKSIHATYFHEPLKNRSIVCLSMEFIGVKALNLNPHESALSNNRNGEQQAYWGELPVHCQFPQIRGRTQHPGVSFWSLFWFQAHFNAQPDQMSQLCTRTCPEKMKCGFPFWTTLLWDSACPRNLMLPASPFTSDLGPQCVLWRVKAFSLPHGIVSDI